MVAHTTANTAMIRSTATGSTLGLMVVSTEELGKRENSTVRVIIGTLMATVGEAFGSMESARCG